MRLVIAGGGTGGHVFPALALADELLAQQPASEVLFVGSTGGLEQRLVPARGYDLEMLRVGKLKGAGPLARLRTLAGLPMAILQGSALLGQFRPQGVVGVGGYASGPVVLAAAARGLPVVLLEQNSVPGITNRCLSRVARRVVTAFDLAEQYFPAGKSILLGNPVRPEILAGRAVEADREKRGSCVLVLGGSQGARAVNQFLTGAAPALMARQPGLRIIHQTGAADEPWVRESYQRAGIVAEVAPFFEDMARLYHEADLCVCRSGATTIAELCVCGVPALLIPYPYAADDHQAHNGSELVQAGAALMKRQESLNAENLAALVAELLEDPARLREMANAMALRGKPDAAAEVVRLLLNIMSERRD